VPGHAVWHVEIQPARSLPLSDLNVLLANSLAAIDRLFELSDESAEASPKSDRPPLCVSSGRIRFARVHFAYGDRPVLNGLDLEIAPGEYVALVSA
jgi:ABC-type multidrug transport system fused ATPase/permease subunit